MSIEIRPVLIKDLSSFVREMMHTLPRGSALPLTLKKAVSQQHNPCASPDEVGLWVAWDGSKWIGYLGILPSRVTMNGSHFPFHWLSSWYVHPDHLRTGAGLLLLKKALSEERDFGITGASESAARIYRIMKLDEVEFKVQVLDFHRPLQALQMRTPRCFHPFLKAAYQGVPTLIRAGLKAQSDHAQCRFELTDQWPVVCGLGDDDVACGKGFERSPKVIQWMLEYPWIETLPLNQKPEYEYFFSHVLPEFQYRVWTSVDLANPARCGAVIFSVSKRGSEKILKVLDQRGLSPEAKKGLAALVIREMKAHQITRLEAADTSGLFEHALWREQSRPYFFQLAPASPLKGRLHELTFHYEDSDAAFF